MKYECTMAEWLANGPSVLASHNITEVHITDCEPFIVAGGESSWWDTRTKILTTNPSDLPHDIFILLKGTPGTGYLRGHFVYPDDDAARADLSQALLAYARVRLPVGDTRRGRAGNNERENS